MLICVALWVISKASCLANKSPLASQSARIGGGRVPQRKIRQEASQLVLTPLSERDVGYSRFAALYATERHFSQRLPNSFWIARTRPFASATSRSESPVTAPAPGMIRRLRAMSQFRAVRWSLLTCSKLTPSFYSASNNPSQLICAYLDVSTIAGAISEGAEAQLARVRSKTGAAAFIRVIIQAFAINFQGIALCRDKGQVKCLERFV